MDKIAIVVGAGGFIGSHVAKRLKADGYYVRGVDLTVNFDNKIQTAQVKTLLNMEVIEGMYNVRIKGFIKSYSTDLIIVSNVSQPVYIFKNQNHSAD